LLTAQRQVFEGIVFLALKETNNVNLYLSLHIKNDNTTYEIRNANRLKAHLLFIRWIDSLCISKGITYYRIAKDCELPYAFLSNVKHGHHKYSVTIDVIILISNRYQFPFNLCDYLA
jgi:hypothetical protein